MSDTLRETIRNALGTVPCRDHISAELDHLRRGEAADHVIAVLPDYVAKLRDENMSLRDRIGTLEQEIKAAALGRCDDN